MTTAERSSVDDATAAVGAGRAEVAGLEAGLRALQDERAREAAAGRGTRKLRQEIADVEGDVQDARVHVEGLLGELEEARDLQLDRERREAVAGVYRDDLAFLAVRRRMLVKRAELAQLAGEMQAVIDGVTVRRTGEDGFTEADYPLRMRIAGRRLAALGVTTDPQGIAPAVPLGGASSNGGDTAGEVQSDIERVKDLLAEVEAS